MMESMPPDPSPGLTIADEVAVCPLDTDGNPTGEWTTLGPAVIEWGGLVFGQ